MQYKSPRIFILMLVAIGLAGCSVNSNSLSSVPKESLYDRVLRSGKIRAAYIIYSAYCMKDPTTGKMSGIGVDALELIAKKLGLTVEYKEEVGTVNMIEGLQTNRYDIVVCPVWTNPNRAKIVSFSKPLLFNTVFAYARKGDLRFRGHLEKINSADVTISTIDGETGEVIAKADFPKAKQFSMPQMTDLSQVFLNVATKKADIALEEPALAAQFMKTNPDTIESVDPMHPVRIYADCWIFKRGELEFKAMLDTVLDEIINSGEMERIIRKYVPNKQGIFLVVKPYR